MEYQREFKKPASYPRISGKRVLTYAALYSDAQLTVLGETVQAVLGPAFTSFQALDGVATHDITIEWAEADQAAEVSAIDATIVTWMEGL